MDRPSLGTGEPAREESLASLEGLLWRALVVWLVVFLLAAALQAGLRLHWPRCGARAVAPGTESSSEETVPMIAKTRAALAAAAPLAPFPRSPWTT